MPNFTNPNSNISNIKKSFSLIYLNKWGVIDKVNQELDFSLESFHFLLFGLVVGSYFSLLLLSDDSEILLELLVPGVKEFYLES